MSEAIGEVTAACTTAGAEVEIVYVEPVSGSAAYEVGPETISTADYHQGQ